jgi:hypothetical protein
MPDWLYWLIFGASVLAGGGAGGWLAIMYYRAIGG